MRPFVEDQALPHRELYEDIRKYDRRRRPVSACSPSAIPTGPSGSLTCTGEPK